jgi:hypothetical protein
MNRSSEYKADKEIPVRVLHTADSSDPRPGLEGLPVPRSLDDGPDGSPPVVLVRWHDAWFDADQADPEDWRPDYPVQTVGFLVRHDGVIVSVAQEILPEGDGYRAVTHIPIGMVESITPLVADHSPIRSGDGVLTARA